MFLGCYLIVNPTGRQHFRLTRLSPRLKPNEFAFRLDIDVPQSFYRRVFSQRLEVPQEMADQIPSLVYQLRDRQGRFVAKGKGSGQI